MVKRVKVPDLSVVLPLCDREDTVGRDVRRLHDHLRAIGASFEILAVNDGSLDNTFALLGLLSSGMPELRVLPADASGRAFVRGAAEAHGAVVVLMELSDSAPVLAPLGWALSRVAAGREIVLLRGRFTVARRLPALPAIARARGRGELFERSLERQSTDLNVEIFGPRSSLARSARRAPLSLADALADAVMAPVRRFLAA